MQHDVGLVIVQAVDPPKPYPPSKTRAQIEACVAAGMPCDVYLYLWMQSNVEADMRSKLALLDGLEDHVGRLWLDIEDVTGATYEARVTAIRRALAVLDTWSAEHAKPRPGIYTGQWWWVAYLRDSGEFSDRDLWVSAYDGIEDATVFEPFGDWSRAALKQFRGTSVLAGVTGVDLNILA